uniref:Serine/threonine-protein phosphatase PGAM5, mitochondrial n=1 Tax=Acrobeloides nanus TaxID=290746 RepID=A0A914C1P6_9BILA
MEANEETRKELLKEVKPTATRHIFLIRHGQYQLDSKEKYLTALGREQAILLGKSLAENGTKFDKCIYSTMNRATETAQLMMEQLPPLKSKSDSILEEGAPYPPEPRHGDWRPRLKEFYTEGSRIEAAFRKYIHRASPKQKEDSYELIVCHANVIRYFICRALQFPPEGWLRMSIGNTGITWLVIRPNGNVSLRYLGEIGHLHPDKLTFT